MVRLISDFPFDTQLLSPGRKGVKCRMVCHADDCLMTWRYSTGYCQVVERRTNRTPEGGPPPFIGRTSPRPCLMRSRTQRAIIDCPEQMTPEAKQIVALAVHAQKSLRMAVRTKSPHLPFLLSSMFM